MDADEIIMTKEWQQLNAEERTIVSEIAGDEKEYNLLKKMLQVSLQDERDIPPVSAKVKEQIVEQLPLAKQRSQWQWLAVAASVAVLLFSAIWYTTTYRDNNTELTMEKPKAVSNQVITPKSDTMAIAAKPQDSAPAQEAISKKLLAKTVKGPRAKASDAVYTVNDKDATQQVAIQQTISTAIHNDTSLLAFVTEIY